MGAPAMANHKFDIAGVHTKKHATAKALFSEREGFCMYLAYTRFFASTLEIPPSTWGISAIVALPIPHVCSVFE